jgi:RNA polymerase sigma-70 factor (ECF subfamily)
LRVLDPLPAAAVDESIGATDERLVLVTLDRLGATDAEVLRLVAWKQVSLAEVSAVLAIEPSATRQRLHRARRNFARLHLRLQSDTTWRPTVATGGIR